MTKSEKKQLKNFRKILCEKGKVHSFGEWYVPIIKLDDMNLFNFTQEELEKDWQPLKTDNPYNTFKLYAHKTHIKKKCAYCKFTVTKYRTHNAYPYEDLLINGRSYTYHTHGMALRKIKKGKIE